MPFGDPVSALGLAPAGERGAVRPLSDGPLGRAGRDEGIEDVAAEPTSVEQAVCHHLLQRALDRLAIKAEPAGTRDAIGGGPVRPVRRDTRQDLVRRARRTGCRVPACVTGVRAPVNCVPLTVFYFCLPSYQETRALRSPTPTRHSVPSLVQHPRILRAASCAGCICRECCLEPFVGAPLGI
jgi:hypothetical protein